MLNYTVAADNLLIEYFYIKLVKRNYVYLFFFSTDLRRSRLSGAEIATDAAAAVTKLDVNCFLY